MKRYGQGKTYKGLKLLLLNSRPFCHADQNELVLISLTNHSMTTIAYDDLSTTDWGNIYERHVGLYYEDLGYTVDYRGYRLGFLDSGIDLVAEKDGNRKLFIQCKAVQKTLGKQAIETILYKGGNFIAKNMSDNKPEFVLAVLDQDQNISPINQRRFLRHNQTQNRSTLSILSLPWAIYPPESRAPVNP